MVVVRGDRYRIEVVSLKGLFELPSECLFVHISDVQIDQLVLGLCQTTNVVVDQFLLFFNPVVDD